MRTRTVVVAALLALSSPAHAQDLTVKVKMRDGVKLATDVYLPKKKKGPWPTLLIRTPYGKSKLKTTGALYSNLGVMVVAQDMRGRFDSEGVDMVFSTDGDGKLKDGHDTMAYIVANKQYSNGLIATQGGSALGIVQYMQATAKPPGLKYMHPVVATPNLYQDGMFNGGVFRHSMVSGWLKGQKSTHFLKEIAKHPFEDSFWAPVQTGDQYGAVTAAGLHQGGWYDIFAQGTIDGWRGYQTKGGAGAKGQQKLLIGPWTHGGAGKQKQGQLTYPKNSTQPPNINAHQIMLNHHLKLGNPLVTKKPSDIPAVRYYVMGDVTNPKAPGNLWRSATSWPPAAAPVRYHLQPGGALAEACPSGGTTAYTFNPAAPSPTICGRNLVIAAGPCDQAKVEARKDVVVFSTPKLAQAVEVTGRVRVHLFVQIDQPDADLMVRLTDVYPGGKSMLLADGAARLASRGSTTKLKPLKAGELVEAVVDLWSTSVIFDKGHRIRVSVTSGNYPRFAVNKGNGKPYPAAIMGAGKPVKVTLHHSPARASYIELPNPARKPGSETKCGAPPKPDAGGPGIDSGGAAADSGGAAGDLAVAPDAAGGSDRAVATVDTGVGSVGGDDEGCSCRAGRGGGAGGGAAVLALLLIMCLVRRGRSG